MKRLPRKRYSQLVAQWNKGVKAFGELQRMIEKHTSDEGYAAWEDQPDMSDPYYFNPTIEEELEHAEQDTHWGDV
tara:strand:+ start:2833 stop:3057 length:225 start_codon:yes stop_codon:yes gene_type:complete